MGALADASIMASTTDTIGSDDYDLVGMISAMCNELLWFLVGFAVIRAGIAVGFMPRMKMRLGSLTPSSKVDSDASQRRLVAKSICADANAGQLKAVLETWSKEKDSNPMPIDALQAVAQALVNLAPDDLVDELVSHCGKHMATLAKTATLNGLLDVIVQSNRPELAETLVSAAKEQLHVHADARTRESLMGSFAVNGDEKKIEEIIANYDVTLRGYSLVIKGLLRAGKADAVLLYIIKMQKQGFEVPPRCLMELFRLVSGLGTQKLQATMDELVGQVPLSAECVAIALQECAHREDIATASHIEQVAREHSLPLNYGAYEPLIKLYAKTDDGRASDLFQDMRRSGFFATEGLCGNLLARCAESQNLRLAESIGEYLRKRSMMTLATYKTLMKVYACCGLYGRACDLHDQVIADGLEPDHVMYGCLVKFAVKCGRTALSHEFFERARGGDIQNYMWLIRAAGREGNINRAMELLRRLQALQSGGLDITVYNCALDVCVTNGDMDQAQILLDEIKASGLQNLVTYNTLMKGHCAKGELPRARRVLREMEEVGHKPDNASYNCLLSTAVSMEDLHEAWDIIGEMGRKGVSLDHYTVSIMMKAARRARNPHDAARALKVLDKTGVNVCEDDVLFNTVLDACIHRRDTERLTKVLSAFSNSKLRPSVHTYGLLIKAYSVMKRVSRCWELWKEMVEQRAIEPNDITLSCMLDALICSGNVEDAVSLFNDWKAKVPPNTVIYSTLIKGFTSLGDAERAMDTYRELQAKGLQMNLVAYTTLIDAHARAGNMEQATKLFEQMEKDGCRPNTITYSTLVKGHCVCGDLDAALRVFHDMLGRGLAADTVIFNTMLDGCVRHSRFELADRLLADMEKYPVEPSNFTLSIVVKMWGKRRQLDDAFAAVQQSLKEGRFRLDPQVGTCLVSACLHNRAIDRAIDAFEQLKTWPRFEGPDAGTYGTLISGLAHHGRCHKAVELAVEACSLAAGPRPTIKPLTHETLKIIFKALHQHGLSSELGALLTEKLRSAGLPGPTDGCWPKEPCRQSPKRPTAFPRGGYSKKEY